MSSRKAQHFRIIGIRPHKPDLSKHRDVDWDKMQSIHKALSEDYKWYMLFEGVTVSDKNERVNVDKNFKKDFSLHDTENMKITISADVGH